MSTLELVKNGRVDVLSPMSANHSMSSILTEFLKIYILKNNEKEKQTKTMNNLGPWLTHELTLKVFF